MTRPGEQAAGPEVAALEDRASVLDLTRDLVRIPSHLGMFSCRPDSERSCCLRDPGCRHPC